MYYLTPADSTYHSGITWDIGSEGKPGGDGADSGFSGLGGYAGKPGTILIKNLDIKDHFNIES
jgi:hypothetical protein